MKIQKVSVAGMGTMGSQIGIVCAVSGFQSYLYDVTQENVDKGRKRIEKFFTQQVKKGKTIKDNVNDALGRMKMGTDMGEAVAGADLIIEAVYENIQVKKQVFKNLDDLSPKEAILASNTSTLWITEIASATSRPAKCIGTHFLIPAALTPLVEVVRGIDTSDDTHQNVIDFLGRCGKETVTVADSPGFLINRLYLPMVNEAFCAIETGLASPEEIDRSCTRGLGLPLGPLAAADAFGLDILLACMNTFRRELGDKYRPATLLVKLVKAGHLGRKSGRGVYDYSGAQSKSGGST
ncbi:MAG: 3-hydroxybutyryl-CoA dehydrogenase [Deltaproteobacteria bacterium]|nr:3-hydroxybutyryl-CoA dehydrogenase [Deltaproteobacteria bacterium]